MRAGSVVTVGTFDGVHLGHRAVLEAVARRARDAARESIAYVFESPPRAVRVGRASPTLLLPVELRRKLLRTFVDRVEVARFVEIGDLSPRAFAERILVGRLCAREVVVGDEFRFGRGRSGDVALLRSLGDELGFAAQTVPPAAAAGAPVSSTRIRRLLAEGSVRDAADLLGRPPILEGGVVRGEGIGRQLGYPTANLDLDPRILLPADGIYLVHAFVEGGPQAHALLYVGRRPTLAESEGDRRCELHLLADLTENLYGRTIQAHLLERLREDRTFSTLAALQDQIARDVEAAGNLVAQHPFSGGPVGG